MYLVANLAAWIAMSKHSAGVAGARMATGDSLLRPNMAWSRSACSVLVGRPVEGPPRWMSQMTTGISVITARPRASVFKAIPGPEVVVTAKDPAYEAPMAEVIAAISSSAWKVVTPKFLYWESSWRMSEAGVMG